MKSLPLLPVLIPTIYAFLIAFIPLVSLETNAQNANHFSLETEKSITIVRTETPPTIDGILGDEAWSQAAVISDFLQSKPLEGAEPTERTEIYLLYDDNMLYIAGRFWDSEPERIAAGTLRHRWNRLGDDDRIAVVLSPYNDQRSGYKFETNANGVKHEAIYQNVSQNLPAWDTIWDAASSINEEGWVTEMAIPFKSISFDSNNNAWGMNFSRAVRRKNEEITWVSRNRTYNPSITGQVNGFVDLDQGVGLDIVPSISFKERKNFRVPSSTSDITPSVDLFYKITPSLNGALTLNTDFSSAEVDSRQVNLTRFGLFFPEKRRFFLQDTDIFEFGRIGGNTWDNNPATTQATRQNARPFFSRKLGLSNNGQPVDLKFGGKLSGRIGRWSLGSLLIRQAEFEDVDASNIFVSRASASVLDESAIGIIVTNGDPRSNLSNSLVGLDFRYLNTRLPGGHTLEADAWLQQSNTEGVDGDEHAFGINVQIPNKSGLRGGITLKEIGRNFNPALGYVNRKNVTEKNAAIGYTHIVTGGFLDNVYTGIGVQQFDSLEEGLETRIVVLRPLEAQSRSRDKIAIRYYSTDESLAIPFQIYTDPSDPSREITIPKGRYSWDETRIDFSTGGHRKFAGSLTYRTGNFYSGEREQISSNITWKPTRHFTLKLAYKYNEIELPQGNFETRLTSLTTEIPFSTNLSWFNLVQYDNISETVGLNSRLHWIRQDGREIFLVLNHNVIDLDRDNRFHSALADLSLKINYTFRF